MRARSHTRAHTRARAVREHDQSLTHATCCDLQYVHREFEDNPSINKRKLDHARACTRALARMRAVRDNEDYIVLATYGESWYVHSKFGQNPVKNKRMHTGARALHARARARVACTHKIFSPCNVS